MADWTADADEEDAWAACAWMDLGKSEIPKLAAARRARLAGGNRKVRYGLSVEFPDADETGMLRPVANSRVSEVGETRLLAPIAVTGQRSLPLDEEG
jgi:hypothetical protein